MGGNLSFAWFDELLKLCPEAERFRNEAEAIYRYADSTDEEYKKIYYEKEDLAKKCAAMEGLLNKDEQLAHIQSLKAQLNGRAAKQEYYVEYVVKLFDKAYAYSNLIISAGFVGLFATWNLMRDSLTNSENRIIAASALFSLIVFAGWEVAKMVHAGITSNKLTSILLATRDDEFDAREMKLLSYGGKWTRFFEKSWIWILVATIVPGFFAGLVLIAAFIDGIFFRL